VCSICSWWSAARDECRGEDALWCRKILTRLRLDSRSVALAASASVTAHAVQTVSDDVQSDARIDACLRCWKSNQLADRHWCEAVRFPSVGLQTDRQADRRTNRQTNRRTDAAYVKVALYHSCWVQQKTFIMCHKGSVGNINKTFFLLYFGVICLPKISRNY